MEFQCGGRKADKAADAAAAVTVGVRDEQGPSRRLCATLSNHMQLCVSCSK